MASRVLAPLSVLALVALAALLRFPGLDALLPLRIEPDPHIPHQVRLIEEADPAPHLDRNWGSYPHLTAWTTIALTDPRPQPSIDAPVADHLDHATWSVLRVRRSVALWSLLLVPATFLLARRFLDLRWSLVASALAGTSLLATHFATQARPHGAAAGMFILCLWACCLHAERGRRWTLALVTATGLLTWGTLQSAVALGFPVLAAIRLAPRRGRLPWWVDCGLPLLGLALGVLLFHPYLLASGDTVAAGAKVEGSALVQGGHRIFLESFTGRGFRRLPWALWSWDPSLLLTAGMGAAFAWSRRRDRRPGPASDGAPSDLRVLLSFAVPYGAVILIYSFTFERFLLPLVGLLAILGACGLRDLLAWGRLPAGRLAAALLVLFPTLVTANLARARSAPSTLHEATAWAERNLNPVGAKQPTRMWLFRPDVVGVWQSLGATAADARDGDPKGRLLDWRGTQRREWPSERGRPAFDVRFLPRFDPEGLDPLEPGGPRRPVDLILPAPSNGQRPEAVVRPDRYLGRLGSGLVLAEVFEEDRQAEGFTALYRALRATRSPVARFSPDGARFVSPHPLLYQEPVFVTLPHQALRCLRAERLGPLLEVYDLRD